MADIAVPFGDLSADRRFQIAGEDAPLWAAIAFALLGLLLSAVASQQISDEFGMAPVLPAPLEAQPLGFSDEGLPAAVADGGKAVMTEANPASAEPIRQAAAPTTAEPPAQASSPPVPLPSMEGGAAPEVEASPTADAEDPKAAACLPVVSIPFDFNSARPKVAGMENVAAPLRDWLAAHKDAILSVEGHADATGPEAYNVLLSYKRAEAAASWLMQLGAPAPQIATRAAGTRPPARRAPNTSGNRQVILRIEGVEACRDEAVRLPTS